MQTIQPPQRSERGSALIISILITVILSLLGISYLMMAQTESTIAENERNAAMALYVAEAGARLAVNWFNDPSTTTGYLVPTTAQVSRTLRLLDTDNDPSTARLLAASGDATKPLYKDAAVTLSPLFDRPYRSALGETFLGIETGTDADPSNATRGPDLVVDASHLTTINNALFPNFPSASLRARVSRIEIYAPPIVSIGGAPTRMGIATVKVIGGVFLYPGTAEERQIATRVVKAVVNELPLPGPSGPIQTCGSLDMTGALAIHWGTGTSAGSMTLGAAALDNKMPTGAPYAVNDPFAYYSNGADNLAAWAAAHGTGAGDMIDDPWFRFVAGGALSFAATTDAQPMPFLSGGAVWPGSTSTDHSNLFQNTPMNCPTFDYNQWKAIAQSGVKNTFYFKHSGGINYKLDGTGTAQSFEQWSTGRTGVMFFDSASATDPNGGGALAPDLSPTAGWYAAGVMYLNAGRFTTNGIASSGVPRFIVPPGEPGDGSGFVNLEYATSFGGNIRVKDGVSYSRVQNSTTQEWFCTDYSDCAGNVQSGTPLRDNLGRPFNDNVAWYGVFYTNGEVEFQGNANYYGSLVAKGSVVSSSGTPGFYFDERIVKGNWPPKEMNLPRVVISAWQTDL